MPKKGSKKASGYEPRDGSEIVKYKWEGIYPDCSTCKHCQDGNNDHCGSCELEIDQTLLMRVIKGEQ